MSENTAAAGETHLVSKSPLTAVTRRWLGPSLLHTDAMRCAYPLRWQQEQTHDILQWIPLPLSTHYSHTHARVSYRTHTRQQSEATLRGIQAAAMTGLLILPAQSPATH